MMYELVAGYAKDLSVFGVVFSAVGAAVWKLFAEPKVNKIVDAKAVKMQAQLDEINEELERGKEKFDDIAFDIKKVLYIIRETAPEEVIKKMEAKAEIFRPKG